MNQRRVYPRMLLISGPEIPDHNFVRVSRSPEWSPVGPLTLSEEHDLQTSLS